MAPNGKLEIGGWWITNDVTLPYNKYFNYAKFVVLSCMTQIITTPRYIYPPRPSASIPLDEAKKMGDMGFTFQFKFSDTRNLIYYNPDGTIELWNRHGEKQKQFVPQEELLSQLKEIKKYLNIQDGKLTVIDGGILHNKNKFIKNTLVVWDILVHNNEYLTGTTYGDRYSILLNATSKPHCFGEIKVGMKLSEDIFVASTFAVCDLDAKWGDLMDINKDYGWVSGSGDPLIEGVVLKRADGVLRLALKEDNNSDWSIRCRIPTKRNKF